MQSDLFREQAIAHQSTTQGLYGQTSGLASPSWTWITWLIALFLIALSIFLLFVSHARTETARGVLRYDSAEARLYVQTEGYIHAVYVDDGDKVEAGQAIAEIRKDHFLSSGGTLSDSTLASLNQERNELARQREAIQSSREAGLRLQAQTRLDSERREATALSTMKILAERLKAAEQRRDDLATLREKGLIAEDVYGQRVDAVAYLKQDILGVERDIADAQSTARRATTEAARLNADANREVSELEQRVAQIDAQLKSVAAEAGYIVRAPHSGRVTGMRARAGERATPDVPLAVIVPNDAQLIAEFYIPSRAIGFIHTGQTVRLMYDAFPHQKFGISKGKVASVSLIGQTTKELGLATQSPDPVYRVFVRPDDSALIFRDQQLPLQTGMEVNGEIVLEERRLFEWLLEPLTSIQRN